ncbi:LOW QUALITY PROTEIN: hypothetical protein PNEG_04326 [Pneumocystis murina B123]|uniref:Uncharacterized protein n=1 Tax=Pneumocystis murina (strain B123) TaxID=1069680 RepID=A0A0W4ZWW4_PNEMU|nr:LOW QUALITY PROTEIN: hypothetical protein PNEG_04326 [Pneumocystis murina B123]KTW32866.1 LOW QUALITY PROTEIN: hypothetical protein PNEG_04326 [Pneumocystis murina B123]
MTYSCQLLIIFYVLKNEHKISFYFNNLKKLNYIGKKCKDIMNIIFLWFLKIILIFENRLSYKKPFNSNSNFNYKITIKKMNYTKPSEYYWKK